MTVFQFGSRFCELHLFKIESLTIIGVFSSYAKGPLIGEPGDLSDFDDGGGRQCAVVVAQVHFIHHEGAHDRGEGTDCISSPQ